MYTPVNPQERGGGEGRERRDQNYVGRVFRYGLVK